MRYKLYSVLFAFLALLLCHSIQVFSENDLVVVVSPDVEVELISRSRLRAIFSMRHNYWADKRRIKVFVLQDDLTLHKRFVRESLGVFPYQLKRIWDKNVFTGIGGEPVTVEDEREMIDSVLNTPGSIGYISRSLIEGGLNVVSLK